MMNDRRAVRKAGTGCSARPTLQSDLAWNPTSIQKPIVHKSLPHLPWPERVGTVFAYSVARLEYWVSPSGILREWFRLVFKVFLFLAIPTVLLCPVITYVFTQAETWTAALLRIALNLLYTLVILFAIGIVAVIGFRLFDEAKK